MAKWAGWGAGPAGAGSAGGPSRIFLALMAIGTLGLAAVLARDGRPGPALLAAAAALYFALRVTGILGRRP